VIVVAGGRAAADLPEGTPRGDQPATSAVSEELVTAARAGDRAAISRVVEAVRPSIARYCRARLDRAAWPTLSADDVTQEVCVALLAALPRYRYEGAAFMAFVYGIAAHKLADARGARARTRCEPVVQVPDAVDPRADPEQYVLRAELSVRLNALLAYLPDVQRQILLLRVAFGVSTAETGTALGMTPGAVRVAQHRALTHLRAVVVHGRPGASRRGPRPTG
jgi:RNA polymerase sigma-70 factor (ECF subfamily)